MNSVLTNQGVRGSFEGIEELGRFSHHLLLLDPRIDPLHRSALVEAVERLEIAPQLFLATSGTTSSGNATRSRLVALSREAVSCSSAAINRHLAATSADKWISALPDFHVGGLMLHHRALISGGTLIRSAGNCAPWNPEHFVNDLHKHQATLGSLVPAQLFDLVTKKLRPPASLRAVVLGGQALSKTLYKRARELAWPVLPSYGMTECCSQVATASLQSLADSTPALEILPHAEVSTELRSTEGALEEFIKVRSGALLSGYLEVSLGGESNFYSPLTDGWLVTSDLGEVNSTQLEILGRAGDVVKIGGEQVSKIALDEALTRTLLALGESQDFYVDFVLDDRLGHEVCLKTTDSARAERVKEEFNRLVHPAARVRRIETVGEIQRTPLGKVRRG